MKHADQVRRFPFQRLAAAWAVTCLLTGPSGAADAVPALSNGSVQHDAGVAADHQGYRTQQAVIQALNDSGRHQVRSYSLAKAQCWLDVSFHEYSGNDRSAFVQAALDESTRITAYLAGGGSVSAADNPAAQTPLLNDATRLRADLWQRFEQLKKHAGLECAAQQLACAEIELVHAGNEHAQLGWRHAKPYVQLAEDLLAEGEAAAIACPPAPSPQHLSCAPVQECSARPDPTPVLPDPVPPPEPAKPVTRKIVLDASMLFKFDRRSVADMLPAGRAELAELVKRLNREYVSIERIDIVGYTDRLGLWGYNLKLSQDRAEAIKSSLQANGVTVAITATGRGSASPVVDCPGAIRTPALISCLQPNRRVEVNITGVPR